MEEEPEKGIRERRDRRKRKWVERGREPRRTGGITENEAVGDPVETCLKEVILVRSQQSAMRLLRNSGWIDESTPGCPEL